MRVRCHAHPVCKTRPHLATFTHLNARPSMQVMDTDDAVELTSALRGIMSANVFSSEEKQKYYKRCMSDDEWDREWAPSIERARVRRETSKKAAEPGGKS